jgi:membrane associated rhomboid family serine protease
MWMLYLFADNVEDRIGPWRFAVFYLVGGVAASAAHIAIYPQSTLPAIGASGAISAVLGAYLVLFPHSRLIVLVPLIIYPLLIEVPAVVYLLLWFLIQFQSGALALWVPELGGGIAWWAHIGGFLAGILLIMILRPRCGKRRRCLYDDELHLDSPWRSPRRRVW